MPERWLRWACQALSGTVGSLLLCLAGAASASGPQSPAGTGDEVQTVLSWCITPTEVGIEQLSAGTCAWQLIDGAVASSRGWDSRVHWMRLELRNITPREQERWLEIGHPQMASMTLYVPQDGRWEPRELGAATPLSERGPVERAYGVSSVRVPAQSLQTVWVRMVSDTVIVLRAKAWEPEQFRARLLVRQFWGSLGAGGLTLTVVFSLLMLVLTRQAAYGYFAMGLLGQFITVSWASGNLLRFFWPPDWISTTSVRDVGTLISVFGMYRFLLSFLPQVQRDRVLLTGFHAAVYITLFFVLARLMGLGEADGVWFASVALSGLLATFICARAWRAGDRAAGIMMLAFCIFLVLTVLRLLVISGIIPFVPEISQAALLGIFLVTPVMLLGLVDRTRQLQDELSRVQAESAAQLRFLAQMSHELRSPLDNVLGNAQLLAREARSASQIGGINSIFDSGRQLLRIIDHILDYARGAAGMLRMEPAPLRVGTFVRGIERMARLMAVQRNNRFELQLQGDAHVLKALTVMADAERLRQVLGNLLGNAARHTSDGLIVLKVNAARLPTARVRLDFSVNDSGEGISLQEQERIFKPFERADSSASYGGKGAGLGLAIARQLVELMHGQLSVHSAPGQGASFRFSVPVPLLAEHAPSVPERLDGFDAVGYRGPRRTVLVVDDEIAGRTVLAQLLEGLGFEVLTAEDGHTAVAMLDDMKRLDLVLTDQYMSHGDGWLVLEAVSQQRPEVPVVLISAAPPSPPAQWDGRLRFAAQFLRPLDHAQLLARMGDLMDLEWTDSVVEHESLPGPQSASQRSAVRPEGAALALPPDQDLQGLAQLIELGQVTAIRDWAQQLQAGEPRYAPFAERILEAVGRLDLQALLELASRVDTDPDSPISQDR